MFLRSKVQEMILRRRSRPMNSSGGAQRSHVPDQATSASTVPCDGDSSMAGASGGKSATARAMFASPRLLHSSSLPTGTVFAKSPTPDADPEMAAFSMSPTSVLDAAAAFVPGPDGGAGKRRPWRARGSGLHGLADALDCGDHHQQQDRIVLAATSASLVRSCSLDRRVEFGVKNKSSWLPLRTCSAREAASAGAGRPGGDGAVVGGLHVRHLPRAQPQDGAHLRRPRCGGRGERAAADQPAGARRPGLLQPVIDARA